MKELLIATRLVLDNWQYSGIAEFVSGAPLLSPWTQGSSSTVGASGGTVMEAIHLTCAARGPQVKGNR